MNEDQILAFRIVAVVSFAIIWKAVLDGVDFWLYERKVRRRRGKGST